MPPAHAQSGEDRARRRQAVLMAGAILILAVAGFFFFRAVRPPNARLTAQARPASRFIVTWRCLACGASERDRAGKGPRTCPQCKKAEVYASVKHACPKHGVMPVAFQYDDRGRTVEVKVGAAAWLPVLTPQGESNARCPQCGVPLLPAETPEGAPDPDEKSP